MTTFTNILNTVKSIASKAWNFLKEIPTFLQTAYATAGGMATAGAMKMAAELSNGNYLPFANFLFFTIALCTYPVHTMVILGIAIAYKLQHSRKLEMERMKKDLQEFVLTNGGTLEDVESFK